MGGTVRFACLFDPMQHWRECAQLSSTFCSDTWADELRRKTLNYSTSFPIDNVRSVRDSGRTRHRRAVQAVTRACIGNAPIVILLEMRT